jgi:hypothetical protein
VTSVWPGAGLSLYWLGISVAAGIALSALGRRAVVPAIATAVALAVAVAPLGAAVAVGNSPVKASGSRTLPAYVTARAQDDARIGTLVITPQPDGGIAASLERGVGETLDAQSTLRDTATATDPAERQLAVLAGNLASRSGFDVASEFSALRIGFVVVAPPEVRAGEGGVDQVPTSEATQMQMRVSSALDGISELTAVGNTAFGLLWRTDLSVLPASTLASAVPASAGGVATILVLIVQGLVIGLTLLLAIPTGTVRAGARRAVVSGAGTQFGRKTTRSAEPGNARAGDENG